MGRQKNNIFSKWLYFLNCSGCDTFQQWLWTCQLSAIVPISGYAIKDKIPIFLNFLTHSLSKERLRNSDVSFRPDSTFTAVQVHWLHIYYWLTAAWVQIGVFIYVHCSFWTVHFPYFVLPTNLVYHLLPWKHALLPRPPSKMAAFHFPQSPSPQHFSY